uniref:Uncharacterized protein n=1 Tax=Chlamydomonas euryale TaxID=1486919 RepID=A0A7R9YUA1_9CHLO|mmetsp:Transcript_21381/g.64111  ORF Transcript_21381/g.64111 Transcript_21381/m.64111 type:complete len:266 (+) Transcript_21381:109-906(+)
MESERYAMDSERQNKLNAKRCIQVLMPNVPGPLIDYALAGPLAGTFGGHASTSTRPPAPPPRGNGRGSCEFMLRKQNSGDFGELCLASQAVIRSGRHLVNNSFGTPTALTFSYIEAASPPDTPRRGASAAASADATSKAASPERAPGGAAAGSRRNSLSRSPTPLSGQGRAATVNCSSSPSTPPAHGRPGGAGRSASVSIPTTPPRRAGGPPVHRTPSGSLQVVGSPGMSLGASPKAMSPFLSVARPELAGGAHMLAIGLLGGRS